MVAIRSAPETAVSVMPMNGKAYERLAFNRMTRGVADPADPGLVEEAAISVAPLALKAVAAEPLTPKAHAILLMAERDNTTQARIMEAVNALDRRDPALQGVVLQSQLNATDYNGAFETIDRLLRVNPELTSQFFPVLLVVLQDGDGAVLLADLFRGEPGWMTPFLRFAALEETALPDLLQLRQLIQIEDPTFHGRLIESLFKEGEFQEAYDVHQEFFITDTSSDNSLGDWQAGHPPFSWSLADQAGFRAQIKRNGRGLDISVDSGRSGFLAKKVVRVANEEPFQIAVAHSLSPADQIPSTKLQLRCGNEKEAFFDAPLKAGTAVFRIARRPTDCEFMEVGLYLRVFSGERAVAGAIESIEFSET